MKGKIKKLIPVFLAAILVLSTSPVAGLLGIVDVFNTNITAQAAVVGGECSETVFWSYDDVTNELTISGTGAIPDYTKSNTPPWSSFKAQILTITIEPGITEIGNFAFSEGQYTRVSIPDTVVRIGSSTINGSTGLVSLEIPASVTSIDATSILNNKNLTEIKVADDNPSYSSVDGVLFNKDGTTLLRYPNNRASSYIVPSTVTTIGLRAFAYCPSVTEVILPEGLVSISTYAFQSSEIKRMDLPGTLETIDSFAFQNACLEEIVIPDNVTGIGMNAFQNCKYLKTAILPENMTRISGNTFYNCVMLEYIVIPENITTITANVFYGCAALDYVFIKNSKCDVASTALPSTATVVAPAGSETASSVSALGNPVIESVAVSELSVDKSEINIVRENMPDLTATLTATVVPEEAFQMPIIWISSDTTVATVENGVISVVSCGEATISAYEPISGLKADCAVTIPHEVTGSTVLLEPTCTEDGVIEYDCVICTAYTEPIPAIGHAYGEWIYDAATETHFRICANDETHIETFGCTFDSVVITTPETCTTDGIKTYTCTVCGGTYTEAIPKTGHAWTAWKTVEGTKTHSRYCANDPLHIQTNDCTYTSAVTTEPTCEETGIRTYTCILCGGTYTEPEPASGHRWGSWASLDDGSHRRLCLNDANHSQIESCSYVSTVVAPYCDVQGYTVHRCTVCSYKYYDSYTSSTGHTFGAWISNNDGTHTRVCINDGTHTQTAECVLTIAVTPPTCYTAGYTTYSCYECGYTYTGAPTDPTDHSWGAWTPDGNGKHIRVCTNDASHTQLAECSYNDIITLPTCTSAGYTTHVCSVCGYSYIDTPVAALEHNYSPWVSDSDGNHNRYCYNDGEHIETVPCSYIDTVTPPTCTQAGYTTHTCTVCGYSYKDTPVSAIGHEWGAWAKNGNGTHSRVCANDAAHIETVNCTYVDDVLASTCTTPGYTTHVCTVCNYTYTGEATPALRHNYTIWRSNSDGTHTGICANDASHTTTSGCTYRTSIIAATCDTKGYTKNVCTLCGYETIEYTAPITGHNYGVITTNGDGTHTKVCTKNPAHTLVEDCSYAVSVVAPTCTEQGYTLYSCESCTYSYKTDYTEAIGHNWSSYINLGNGTHQAVCANDATHTKIENCYDSQPETVAADCTSGTKIISTCECCGYESFTVKAGTEIGHNFVRDSARDIAPTINTKGREGYTCTRCSENNDVILPALSTWHVPVTSITVSSTKSLYCTGENTVLTATVLPSNASYKGVTWTSSDTSIATISSNGTVSWLSRGSVTFTATSNDPYGNSYGSTTISGGYSSPSYTINFEVSGNCSYSINGTVYTDITKVTVAAGETLTFITTNAKATVSGAEITADASSVYRISDIHANATVTITANTVQQEEPEEKPDSSGGSFFDKIAAFFEKLFSMISSLFGG